MADKIYIHSLDYKIKTLEEFLKWVGKKKKKTSNGAISSGKLKNVIETLKEINKIATECGNIDAFKKVHIHDFKDPLEEFLRMQIAIQLKNIMEIARYIGKNDWPKDARLTLIQIVLEWD